MDKLEALEEIRSGDVVEETLSGWLLVAGDVTQTPRGKQVNFHIIHSPFTDERQISFGDWKLTSNGGQFYCGGIGRDIILKKLDNKRFGDWKYGSYIDFYVHRVNEADKLENRRN